MSSFSFLSDQQYNRIKHQLPGKVTDRGSTIRDNCLFVDAVLWILTTGGTAANVEELQLHTIIVQAHQHAAEQKRYREAEAFAAPAAD